MRPTDNAGATTPAREPSANGAGGGKEKIVRTQTFGVNMGAVCPYVKGVIGDPTQDAARKEMLGALIEGAKAIGAAQNIAAARLYASKVLGLDASEAKPSVKAIRDRIAKSPLYSSILDSAVRDTRAIFSGEHGKSLLGRGNRQLSTYRMDGTAPIPLRDGCCRVLQRGDDFWLAFAAFSREASKARGWPTWIAVPIVCRRRDRQGAQKLAKIASGRWELRSAKLRRARFGKVQWRVGLAVRHAADEEAADLDPETVMGIDVGMTVPAAVHVARLRGRANEWSRKVGNGPALLKSRKAIVAKIKRLRRQMTRKDFPPLEGEAREKARMALRTLRRRERDLVKTVCRRVAKTIANIALKEKAGVWAIEDLDLAFTREKDDEEKKSWMARHWAPGVLLDALKWNAKKMGARVVEVPPAHTSQRCPECGFRARANRPKGKRGWAFFKCLACGFSSNADKVAARNIAALGLKEIDPSAPAAAGNRRCSQEQPKLAAGGPKPPRAADARGPLAPGHVTPGRSGALRVETGAQTVLFDKP